VCANKYCNDVCDFFYASQHTKEAPAYQFIEISLDQRQLGSNSDSKSNSCSSGVALE